MSKLRNLCLNMIVKNEEDNLPNLFATLHKYIDYYVICDTGSQDRTVEVIKEEMGKYNIEGEIFHDEWVNFGHNRQLALERAVGKTKYALIIDADEKFECTNKDFPNNLKVSGYNLLKTDGGENSYYVPNIISLEDNNKWNWRWVAPVHEYLDCDDGKPGFKKEELPDIIINRHELGIGGRSKGLTQKEKYLRDAAIFEKELEKKPDDSRSRFYLAQSYKDANEPEKAIKNYIKRIEIGGWVEETYYAYLMLAEQMKKINRPFEDWGPVYLKAYQLLPTRMEALYFLVDHYRLTDEHHLGHLYGKIGARINRPATGLFLFNHVYNYLMYDAYAVCAYWAGDYEDCACYCKKLLRDRLIPQEHVPRIKQNLEYARDKIKQFKKSGQR